ncbi:DDE-type integrase/transposase/recombinase [Nonomuraea sp. MTCD27]|uniref:DDE-type integrase/transposase/recombinase n=1 Tax=Nonomuraea sp. MTCD27 TaxID=1676747 RepID=UPI0035C1381F
MQEARPRIAAELGISPGELAGLHRRFEVVPGAQAQVGWGDEGKILAHVGIQKVYSFHMTLSYSRHPFCCFTTSQDLATFFDCHRRAFEHFGEVPMSIVYDRTKTVVRRHVAPGEAVPLHPRRRPSPGITTSPPDVPAIVAGHWRLWMALTREWCGHVHT